LWSCIIGFVILASVLSKVRRRRRRTQLYAHAFGHEVSPTHPSLYPLSLGTATIGAAPNGHGYAAIHAATNGFDGNGHDHDDIDGGGSVAEPANEATW
ncbi:MAG TPA: hypothetical protein VFN75_03900, partial [Pseudonocardiaceae bacterium]|nr:hypothetical protein [Pseudonocardiaceae bacterium]